ncbi:Gliding motility-associated, C-terminal domain [Flavobacteriaceae bacterium]
MKKINKTYFFLFLITLLSFSVSAQLFRNGNLEAGGSGTGFRVTDYTLSPLNGTSTPGFYAWTNNPNTMDSSFISGGDHTTGSGKMLVYNGSTSTTRKYIWTTGDNGSVIRGFTDGVVTTNFIVGNTYTFSYWIKSVSNQVTDNATRARIGIFFENASTINPSTLNSVAPLPSDGWQQVQFSFRATNILVMIRLWDDNINAVGNDFALDDFSIREGGLPLTLSHTSVNPTCPSTLDGSIIATAAGGNLPYGNFLLVSSTSTISNSTGIFNNLAAGSYTLTVRDNTGLLSSPVIINLAPPNDITVSASSLSICEGESTTLSVSGSTGYLWTAIPADPTLTAANNTSANPIVSPTLNTTYTVKSGVPADPTNLVYNGDFSLGDSGFNTGYAYPTSTLQQGTYGIVTNPDSWFSPFESCADNTQGSGTRNMFVADGATSTPLTLVYKPFFSPPFFQPGSPDVAIVLPNKSYTFSFFLANVVGSGSLAALEVIINGVRVGNLATVPLFPCNWVEHFFVWNSGSNTTATISIFDTNIDGGGNDFAIDDIKFRETPVCLYEKSVAITVNSSPTAPIVGIITPPTCALATGSVALSGLPATGTWTVTTTPGGFTTTGTGATTTFSGLAAGTYTFKVTNATGCTSAVSATAATIIAQPETPSAPIIGAITQPTCALATGSVALSGLPSSGSWTVTTTPRGLTTTGTGLTTTFSGLVADTYSFTVTNASGCTSAASATNATIITQPSPPSAPIVGSITHPTCTLSTGSVALSGLPASGTWTVTTIPSGLTTTGTGLITTFSGLAADTYSFTVTNDLGCTSSASATTATINIQPVTPAAPTVGTIIHPTCTTATGSVILTGLPSGNWTINPGGITGITTSKTISLLASGSYTFTVTNAVGCESIASANVIINAALTIPNPPTIGTITQPTCTTATGSVVLNDLPIGNWTINPGAITGNSTSTTITGLTQANYTYTVTNSDGCTSSASANVGINAQPVTPSAPLATATIQPTCLALGTIVVSGPLNPNYEYSSGGAYQSTLSFSILAPNTYLVTVKDILNGCVSLPTSVVVNSIPTVATPTIASIVQPTCLFNGTIDIASPLGINIEYSNGGTYQSSTTFSNLVPNTYSITAKNTSNGCVSSPLTVVINPIPFATIPTFATIAPVCFGNTISLPNPSTNGIFGTWSPAFDPTTTTTYTYTPNPGQCSNNATIQVAIVPIPVGTASPTTETICSLQSTGISLSSSLSGTTFSWTTTSTAVSDANPGSGNAISQILTATSTLVGNAVYTIIPTYNGCSGSPLQVTIFVTPKPIITATPNALSICSGSTATVAFSSSMPSSTVFSWNLVQTNVTGGFAGTGTSISQNLSTISNAFGEVVYAITPSVNGCSGITTMVSIAVNPIPVATINPASGQTICSGETTSIALSSSVINTSFSWNVIQSNLFGTSSDNGATIAQTLSTVIPSIGTANYVITPTAQGCIGTSVSVTVNVNPTPEFFGTPTQLPICSGDSTSIVLTPSLFGTSFSWTVSQNGVSGASNGSGNTISQTLETTGNTVGTAIYIVKPTLNSCYGAPITISATVNPLPKPEINDGIICADASGIPLRTFTLDSGLNAVDYTFQWYLNGILESGTAGTLEAFSAGNYSVIATNILTGCISVEVFATVTASIPATSISAVGTVAFDENGTIIVTALATNPNYEYALDYGALQSSNVFTNVNPGNHTVMVTDIYGCTNLSTTISIIGYPTYFTPNGDGINDFWNIIGLENQPSAKIYIFDRHGKLIKQISSKSSGWDGTYNGALLTTSDYWFTIEYIEPLTTDLKIFKSHFSLKR